MNVMICTKTHPLSAARRGIAGHLFVAEPPSRARSGEVMMFTVRQHNGDRIKGRASTGDARDGHDGWKPRVNKPFLHDHARTGSETKRYWRTRNKRQMELCWIFLYE